MKERIPGELFSFTHSTYSSLVPVTFVYVWDLGAVCAGFGALGVPVLEEGGSALHVLSHPASKETVDQTE